MNGLKRRMTVFVCLMAVGLWASGCDDNRGVPTAEECGDGVCEGDEDATSCPEDCPGEVCGDGVCEGDEDATSCPEDCATTECGDGVCEGDEDETSCPQDCVVTQCGDDVCNGDETPYDCPEDCAIGICGNGICDAGEESDCPEDCGADHCGNGICEGNENPATCLVDCAETSAVDVLFVIDNTGSMQNEQMQLQASFPAFYEALENTLGMIPDVHIGVVTPDLGTGSYNAMPFCNEVGGDGGILGKVGSVNLGETCLGAGQRYLVDLEPEACTIQRDNEGQCIDHDCDEAACQAMAQGDEVLTLVTDQNGCPRCQNFPGSASDTFSCLADVGIQGCGFEQQLESMYRALDTNLTPENQGFLREDALLVVVMVTDEDDCSASEPDVIFDPDPAQNSIDSTLGYLHSFRCFEFGVTCDINDRTQIGPRNDCEPREDSNALLHFVSRYVDFIGYLKDPGRTVVMSLAGPVDEVAVTTDPQDRPMLDYSCTDTYGEGAVPGIRLAAFASHFNGPSDMDDWAYSEVCVSSFLSPFESLGLEIKDRLGY